MTVESRGKFIDCSPCVSWVLFHPFGLVESVAQPFFLGFCFRLGECASRLLVLLTFCVVVLVLIVGFLGCIALFNQRLQFIAGVSEPCGSSTLFGLNDVHRCCQHDLRQFGVVVFGTGAFAEESGNFQIPVSLLVALGDLGPVDFGPLWFAWFCLVGGLWGLVHSFLRDEFGDSDLCGYC